MEFEWDPLKAAVNETKHKISFEASLTVFLDPNAIEVNSSKPEHCEVRRKMIGEMKSGNIVAVIFTDRGDVRRIISARSARRNERAVYDQSKAST